MQLCGSLSILWYCLSLGLEWKLTFSSPVATAVFQICWHIECSTFTAASFRIWNSSTGIPSPPLALFVVMLPKAHLTSHSRMSGSRWVITPSWLSGLWRPFLEQPTILKEKDTPGPVLTSAALCVTTGILIALPAAHHSEMLSVLFAWPWWVCNKPKTLPYLSSPRTMLSGVMGAVKCSETNFNWRSGSSHLHWALLVEHFDLFF